MSIIKCPECQQPVSSMAGTCPHCGVKIAGNIVRCNNCGNYCSTGQKECPTCGTALKAPTESTKPEETTTRPSAAPTKKKRGCIGPLILFLLLAVLIAGGLYWWHLQRQQQREAQDYAMLENVMNPAFYEQFLREHPGSQYAPDVKRRMDLLLAEADEWQQVLQSRKRIHLLRFQQAHPNSLHARECRDMIDSIDWLDARGIGTAEAMQDYISNHPDGLYASEAADSLNRIITSRITPEEKSVIRGVLNAFFSRGLALQDSACIAESMADSTMERFCNTRQATPNQILSFTKEKMAEDVIGIHYLIDTGMNVRRETLPDGTLGVSADFALEETVNRADVSKPSFHTYRVAVLLNAERKIVQMNIK